MRRPTGFLMLCLATACGPGGAFEQDGPRSPRFVLQGDCEPSVGATVVSAETNVTHCTDSQLQPTLFEDDAAWTDTFGANCAHGVDLAQQRFLLVPARGAQQWFVFPSFVAQRDGVVEVGLVIRPQGALPPDALLHLPRDGRAVELRWCHSVCVENCDVAIP